MADTLGVLILAIGGWLTLAAFFTTLTFLLPGRITRAAQVQAEMPGRSFVIGLVNGLFFGLIAVWLLQGNELLQLFGLLILLFLLAAMAVGVSGLLQLLRRRIYPETDGKTLPQTWRAALLLVGAALAPLLGWFVLAPIMLISGLGAAILTRRKRKAAPDPLYGE